MKFRDITSGIFWLIISFLVCMESARVDVGSFKRPGPGFLPFWAGIVLGIFGAILLITTAFKKKPAERKASLWKGLEWHKVLIVLAGLIIYAILLASVGYLIMTFALMLLLFGVIERPRLWVQLVTALITVFATYLVFYVWLGIQLPKGLIEF
jgi:putative tricarboxylic transport membrane protein